MNPESHKLIEVLKKRLSIMNRNKYISNQKDNKPKQIFKLRFSTDYHEIKTNTFIKHDKKQFLFEDQINLKIVPLIKKDKCIFKYENLLLNKSPDKKNNNGISTSFRLPTKTYKKRFLFKSPFQEGKKNKNKLKIMVDFSKKMHSHKYNEKNLNRDILKTYSRNNAKLRNNIQKIYLKTYGNENHIFNKFKLDDSTDKFQDNHQINIEYEENKNELLFLKNIIKNKERNRRAKNYYNKIHVNKMNKIIEKFSFNNYD